MAVRRTLTVFVAATFAIVIAGWIGGLFAQDKAVPAPAQGPAAKSAPEQNDDAVFKTKVLPFLKKYCLDCHNNNKASGGLILEGYVSEAHARKDRKTWANVEHHLASGEMPPKKKTQPAKDEREFIINWIENTLTKIDCTGPKDPGRVTIRRLNRAEYNNTIRDLCGVDLNPAEEFPADDVGYGFDNIGDVLSFQPILLEKYLAAADKVLTAAIKIPPIPKSERQSFARRTSIPCRAARRSALPRTKSSSPPTAPRSSNDSTSSPRAITPSVSRAGGLKSATNTRPWRFASTAMT